MNVHAREVAKLVRRVSELERRLENTVRHGTVSDVDTKKQRFRLVIGVGAEGSEQKSPWIPYGQHAGDYKHHAPPTKGMTYTLFSPGGDFSQSVAMPLTWSNKNKSPSDKPDEHVITYSKDGKEDDQSFKEVRRHKEHIIQIGKVKIHIRPDDKDEVHVSVGDTKLRLHEQGIEAIAQTFLHTGDVVRHGSLDIGNTHRHRDVMIGGDLTGLPTEAGG